MNLLVTVWVCFVDVEGKVNEYCLLLVASGFKEAARFALPWEISRRCRPYAGI